MKKPNKIKTLILVTLFMFPIAILFGFLPLHVRAGEQIPDEPNLWHWHDDIKPDERLIYEAVISGINMTNGEMIINSKELIIYNITGFENGTLPSYGNASMVMGRKLYYNCTSGELVPYNIFGDTPHMLSAFGINHTGTYLEYYNPEHFSTNCLILPINGTNGLEPDIMAEIINNTVIHPYDQLGYLSRFNRVTTSKSPDNNLISFENTTDGFFINNTYYDNGILKYAEAYYFQQFIGATYVLFNVTMKRIFDYDILDEIEWGVDVGDTLYFGSNDNTGYDEIKFDITGFTRTLENGYGSFGPTIPIYWCYENVLANISVWDNVNEEYDLTIINHTIGLANNFFPLKMGDNPYIIPINTTFETFSFMFNNRTHEYSPFFMFDFTQYSLEDGNIALYFSSSTLTDDYGCMVIDQESGLNYMLDLDLQSYPMMLTTFLKNHTTVVDNTEFRLYSDVGTNYDLSISVEASDDLDLYWATLDRNPLNETIPFELPDELELYLDIYTNKSAAVNNATLKVEYDQALLDTHNIEEEWLQPYYFDEINKEWVFVPKEYYQLDNVSDVLIVYPQNFSYYGLGVSTEAHIEWGVEVGDIIYSSSWMGTLQEEFVYRKIEIVKINTTTINMTQYGLYDPNRPEMQQFSEVYAKMYYYNKSGGKWELPPNPIALIAAANHYYPFIPYAQIASRLIPIGTTASKYAEIYNNSQYAYVYDELTIQTNYIKMRNTTEDKALEIWLDPNGGFVEYMGGWTFYTGVWYNIYMFHLTNMSLDTGTHNIQLTSTVVNDWNIDADIACNNFMNLLWAILPRNPTNYPLYPGLPEDIELYIDILFDPDFGEPDSFNMTIDYSGVDLIGNGIDELELYPFYFQDSEYQWIHPSEFDTSFSYIIDSINDKMDMEIIHNSVFAIGRDIWSVDIGDVLYAGQYGGASFNVLKYEIIEIRTIDLNLTEEGITASPEVQTFSYVIADRWYWNGSHWKVPPGGDSMIGLCNDNWPILPIDASPFLMPIGTTGTDILSLVSYFMPMYDSIITGTDSLMATNTTNGLSMTIRLDPTLGLILYNIGWAHTGSEWVFYTYFAKNNASLSLGANNDIPLINKVLSDYIFTADITTNGSGVEFLYSLFDVNPANASIPSGTPLGYLEFMYTNHSRVSTFDLTIDPPESVSVSDFALWKWNETLSNWEQIPTIELDTMLTINTDGTITIALPTNSDIHLYAFTSTVTSEGEPGIPGFDLFVLIGVISLLSITVIFTKRRKLLKL